MANKKDKTDELWSLIRARKYRLLDALFKFNLPHVTCHDIYAPLYIAIN